MHHLVQRCMLNFRIARLFSYVHNEVKKAPGSTGQIAIILIISLIWENSWEHCNEKELSGQNIYTIIPKPALTADAPCERARPPSRPRAHSTSDGQCQIQDLMLGSFVKRETSSETTPSFFCPLQLSRKRVSQLAVVSTKHLEASYPLRWGIQDLPLVPNPDHHMLQDETE